MKNKKIIKNSTLPFEYPAFPPAFCSEWASRGVLMATITTTTTTTTTTATAQCPTGLASEGGVVAGQRGQVDEGVHQQQ